MKVLGIVYAISTPAGDAIKFSIAKTLNIDPNKIVTDEQPKDEYDKAKNDMASLGKLMFKSIVKLLDQIDKNDELIIIVAANSVHRAFPNLRNLLNESVNEDRYQLLSIVDVTIEACEENNIKRVLLLASNSTIQSGLYQTPLNSKNIEVTLLPEAKQTKLDKFIKQGIYSLDELQESELIRIIQEANAIEKPDGILFGCAELKTKLNKDNLRTQIIDGSELLIKAVSKAFPLVK